jgi:hypothetical protein
MILKQDGNTLYITWGIPFLEEYSPGQGSGYGYSYGNSYGSQTVNLYPGCNKSMDHCINRFDNILNYGGFPWIPGKNPFGGTSIV